MFQVFELNLTATFYFDTHGSFVRYDFIAQGGPQAEIGVITLLFNMRYNDLNDEIFLGSGACPSWAIQTTELKRQPVFLFEGDDRLSESLTQYLHQVTLKRRGN
eukprot:TRINITY_DN2129_c0_g1_i1.p3 TRINITY_DN2129_c0_g1~~TRINITY_DN2129_c0_g1_i1.p3  ORF type:complete len:104 (+),score=23.70 TRINITY_DN2129_c0_g1_i1:658-969(+)